MEIFNSVQEAKEFAKQEEKRKGYYIHSVVDDSNTKVINCHTHGILRNFGLLDLQIINPNLPSEKVIEYLKDITSSYLFKHYNIKNDKVYYINNDLIVIFKLVIDEFGMIVYRIIFHDKNGYYPWEEECDINYKNQWTEQDQINNQNIINY